MEQQELLYLLTHTRLLSDELKWEMLQFFSYMSQWQKEKLYMYLKEEKKIFLDYLKWLKEQWVLTTTEIKMNFDTLQKQKISQIEMNDKENEFSQAQELLLTID